MFKDGRATQRGKGGRKRKRNPKINKRGEMVKTLAKRGDEQRAGVAKPRKRRGGDEGEERKEKEKRRRKKSEYIKLHSHTPCRITAAFEHSGKFVAARATRLALLSWASSL